MSIFYKKTSLKEFIPHVYGMILIANAFVHLGISIFLSMNVDTSILSSLDGISFSKQSIRYISIAVSIVFAVWQFFNGIGIYKRNKKAAYSTILILFITSAKFILLNSFPQIVFMNLFFLVLLLLSWKYFDKNNSKATKNYQEIVAWVTVILALVYGISGSYILRTHYVGLKTLFDAVYYTIITYSTVGYGDIYPISTEAKIFTVSMVLIGLGSFITTVTFVIGPKIETKIRGIFNLMGNLGNMKEHVILCGFSELAKAIVKQLKNHNIPYVIIDNALEAVNSHTEEEYIIFKGMISSVKTFEDVNIKKAKAVIIAFDKDPENILTALTVKEALENVKNAQNIKVITRIENDNNLEKARKIGVHDIISPSSLAAKSIIGSL